jgi:glycosyltransferase involved in cell wall biosynthesis
MGAPQNRLLELSKGFMKDGWEILIVTAMPNYPKGKIFEEYEGKFSSEETIEGIRTKRLWLYASNSGKSIPRIISMISFSATSLFSNSDIKKFKPDYVFVESPPLTLAMSGYILSKLSGSKLIMNVSDIWPLSAKELGVIGEGFLYRQIEKLEKFLYKKSFLCSGQSEEIVSHIRNNETMNEPYLFRNGVDIKRFPEPHVKADPDKNFKIVYAGLIGVAQGIPDIAKSINFSEVGAELHIYGEGSEKKILEEFLKENPGRNVFLHNSVGRNEIPDVISKYDSTIIPLVRNIYGAVPSKIYEAMAAGLPILFSGSGEGANIVKNNNAGLVSGPKDFENLKKNIVRLKNSAELRIKMSLNCRKTAEEKFDRNKLIKDFSEHLKKFGKGKQNG